MTPGARMSESCVVVDTTGRVAQHHGVVTTMTGGRRRFLKQVLGAAVGGAVVPWSGAAAWAGSSAGRRHGSLPSVGSKFTTAVDVLGVPAAVSLLPGTEPLPMLDFVGTRSQRVVAGGDDHVRLVTLAVVLRAQHPLFGQVTLGLPDIEPAAPGSLHDRGESGLRETWVEAFSLTFDRTGDEPGPFVYSVRQPFTWVADMGQWPPPPLVTDPDGPPGGGALYSLQTPMVFTNEDTTIEFTAFPARIGQM